MYIFGRMRSLDGRNTQAIMTGAVELAELVSSTIGIPIFTWQAQYGPTGNAVGWSMRVDSMAALEAANDTMAASAEVMTKSQALLDVWNGVSIDTLNQVVAGSLGDTPAKYISVTSTRAAPGHQVDAAEWGAALAEKASESMDIPIAFVVGVFGSYGTLGWITALGDAAGLDETRGKLMADTSLAEMIDAGSDFVQADATNVLLRRIG